MASGVQVSPPMPDLAMDFWQVAIRCPCGAKHEFLLPISLVDDAAAGGVEHIGARLFRVDGWQVDPPRCPTCIKEAD